MPYPRLDSKPKLLSRGLSETKRQIIMFNLQRIRERAAANLKHIVLRGEDPRTVSRFDLRTAEDVG